MYARSSIMYHFLKCAVLALAINDIAYVASEKTRSALLIIDVQDCFLPGGSLAVDHAEVILPVIKSIRENNTFDLIVFSQDWHLPGHVSFASAHNKSAFDAIILQYLDNGTLCLGDTVTSRAFPGAVNCNGYTTRALQQVLYPDHCIRNVTSGPTSSMISRELLRETDDFIVYKGVKKEIDAYSAFFDNGHFFNTRLDAQLKTQNIDTVFITGLALDICVFYTSMDAKELGYNTYIVTDASVGINPENVVNAFKRMADKGIKLITHDEIPATLQVRDCSDFQSPGLILMVVLLLSSMQVVAF